MASWMMYIGAGYISTSLLLFFMPKILHKTKVYSDDCFNEALNNKKILRISHRGGPRLTTQNTIEAFKKVLTVSDMLQMDICETADGVLVVHHDQSLKRSCGIDKHISDYKFAQLPKFQDQIKLDFAYRKTIITNNEKIPTLEQVYQMFPGTLMNIQLKTPSEQGMKQFARLTYEYDRQNITICGIRNKNNQNFKKANPNILSFMNDRKVISLYLAYFVGLAPFMKLEENSLQIPVYSQELESWAIDRAPASQHMKIRYFLKFIKFINFISKPLIWHLKQRGIMTLLWVCNDQQSFDRAVWMGGQGIMTDQPFELDKYLQNKKLA